MFSSRILVALAASLASGLAIAQATAPAAPAAAPKAAQAPATPAAAPPPSPNAQRAPGKASATPGTGAQAGSGTAGKASKSKDGTQRGQLHKLYAGVMTDDEKSAYRNKVREVKTYDQCKALLEETNKVMEPRAKAKGEKIAQTPTEACDQAKARGRVKG